MNTAHRCRWPDCPVMVGVSLWGCSSHWYRLPNELRDRITQAWEHGTPRSHLAAVKAANRWCERQQQHTRGES